MGISSTRGLVLIPLMLLAACSTTPTVKKPASVANAAPPDRVTKGAPAIIIHFKQAKDSGSAHRLNTDKLLDCKRLHLSPSGTYQGSVPNC